MTVSTSGSRAHPRSRRDNVPVSAGSACRFGSSPLTRGKRVSVACGGSHGGLIPTHARKTLRGSRPPAGSRAHPRSRGENRAKGQVPSPTTGSSPLTRGKLVDGVDRDRAAGLIPAHAGKTALFTGRPARSWAHPRSREEDWSITAMTTFAPGSSPLARGKHLRRYPVVLRGGLIPTCAGKTPGNGRRNRRGRAHPRSRGENAISSGVSTAIGGSSPLTRGKREAALH